MSITDITALDMEALKRILRDYVINNISSDVLSDPAKSSAGDALLSVSAYPVSEIATNQLNWQVNESNLDSCTLRSSAERLARNNAYNVHSANASEVQLQFDGTAEFTLPRGFRCSASAESGEEVIFSTTEAGTSTNIGGGVWRVSLSAINAEYKTQTGTTNGVEDFEITLQGTPVIIDSELLSGGVVINGLTYTGITNRINSDATSRTFIYYHNDSNQLVLRFGDNEFGAMVPHNVSYTISYKVGGGLQGNVVPGSITTLKDSLASVTTVTNLAAATGGADEESINEIKVNAINNVFVRKAAITDTDYESIAIEVNGIGKAQAAKNIASGQPPTIDLYLASEGATFAVPDEDKLAEVIDYFYDKQPLGVNLNCYDATEQKCKVVVDVALENGTNQSEAENTIKTNIAALLYYPETTFDTTLLVADILDVSNINGVQGPNVLQCHIIPTIVPVSTNEGNPTNPKGVILRDNCEVALNKIVATGATTFAVTKKIPRVASVLTESSVKDLTVDYSVIESESTSITKKSDTSNTLTDDTLAMEVDEYAGYLLVDADEDVFLILSNTATTFTLDDNALNQGAGDYDVVEGEYKVVRSFMNKEIERNGNTRTVLYNTQNQWFIDDVAEGALTLIISRGDRFYLDSDNGSGSVNNLYISTDKDYCFTLVSGTTPFRATPPNDEWNFISSEYSSDIIYKGDSDLLTINSDSIEVHSYYRKER